MNGIRIVHRLDPATNVGLVARIPEFVVDDALADPPVEVAQIKCCGAFICRMSRHWKIVRFWNSDSVGWKLWPQTALSNSAAAKGVPQAATEHARRSEERRVGTACVRPIGSRRSSNDQQKTRIQISSKHPTS